MILDQQDEDLYFKLMQPLQFYANQKRGILSEIKTLDEFIALPQIDRMGPRDAIYDDPAIIDEFTADNPNGFSAEELAIVGSWKHFLRTSFFIERFLKKYAIFISEDQVYAVHGLREPLDLIVPQTPAMVDAVLLPFKGRIIYDGSMNYYSIFFGGGTKRRLKETYMTAKQNNRIIHTLEPAEKPKKRASPTKTKKTAPNAQDLKHLDTLADIAKNLRGGTGKPVILTPVYSVVRAAIELARTATEHPDDSTAMWETAKSLNRALGKFDKTVRRMD